MPNGRKQWPVSGREGARGVFTGPCCLQRGVSTTVPGLAQAMGKESIGRAATAQGPPCGPCPPAGPSPGRDQEHRACPATLRPGRPLLGAFLLARDTAAHRTQAGWAGSSGRDRPGWNDALRGRETSGAAGAMAPEAFGFSDGNRTACPQSAGDGPGAG